MILGGVWHRFPDLRMVVVHGGGYLPFYFARTDHAYKVRPETRRKSLGPPASTSASCTSTRLCSSTDGRVPR